MAFFKTNLDCTVDGVRTLTPADYIVKYHPYWDGSNPYFDVDSERILFFKSGYQNAINSFLSLIEMYYNPNWDGCYCVAVPSHDPDKVDTPVHELIRQLVSSHRELHDASGLLVRTTKIDKLSTGGNRSIDVHLNSIKIDDSKINVKGKNVLLLDDVIATGNSIMACVLKLKSAGAKSVFVLSLAKTVDDRFAVSSGKNVYVSRIQVKKLFGSINYDIDLSNTNPVAILTAPNGRGKTTILNLLSFVLNPEPDTYKAIRDIPFDSFRCILPTGYLELKRLKKSDKNNNNEPFYDQKTSQCAGKMENLPGKIFLEKEDLDLVLAIETNKYTYFLDEMHTYANEVLAYEYDMNFINYFENFISEEDKRVYNENIDHIPTSSREKHMNLDSDSYLKFMSIVLKLLYKFEIGMRIPVNYIKADRIQPVVIPHKDSDNYFVKTYERSPLEAASNNISKLIKNTTERYNAAVSQAKDKLPQMFLDGKGSNLDCQEFIKEWSVYRKELDQFQEIGLIDPTGDFTAGKDIPGVYNNKGKFLSTYLTAFKDTTIPLKKLYKQLSLFKKILDERNFVTGKKVKFTRNGISMFASNRKINLNMLSSGEKHDFMMFYNLVFNVQNNGLVLIDEPEISLHVEWQETYLDKLLDICKMNGLQAIVATHSPNIISSHYDLMVDKGESYESD